MGTVSGHNTSGKLFRFDRVVKWKMHFTKSSQENAFVHSKTLFVKSKIICKQFTSLKRFATDMKSIDVFKSYTVLFHFSTCTYTEPPCRPPQL